MKALQLSREGIFFLHLFFPYFINDFRLFWLIFRFVGAMYSLSMQYELLPRQGPQSGFRALRSHGDAAFPSGLTKSVYKA